MKILACSDLHTEYQKDNGTATINSLDPSADVCVIAGDLSVPSLVEEPLIHLCDKYSEVVFVCGNHDFYNSSFDRMSDKLNNLSVKLKNLHWLENKVVEINGKRFVGATLWFKKQEESLLLKHYMCDFEYIENLEKVVFDKFNETVNFFSSNIRPGDVVVSHHMPSLKCVDKKFKNSRINIYFANDLDFLIEQTKPAVYICGHSHCSCDFNINETRIILNPFGYVEREFNTGFKNNKIIEV